MRNTKRRLEHSNSPASSRAASLHPTETVSPAKKIARRASNDDIKVEELIEGDTGYITDGEVVYPDELEEINSDSDNDWETASDISDSEATIGLSREFSHLGCSSSPEADFESLRRQRHRHRRNDSRKFKRTHSQSVSNETDVSDVEALADHDLPGSQRRLRRRTRGPQDAPVDFLGFAQATAEPEDVEAVNDPAATNSVAVSGDGGDMDVDEPK
jgi:hypothetical protein